MSLNTIRHQWASDPLVTVSRRSFQCPHAQNLVHKDSFPSLVWKNYGRSRGVDIHLLSSSLSSSPLAFILLSGDLFSSPPLLGSHLTLIFTVNSDKASVTLISHSGFPPRNTFESNDTAFYIDCICPQQVERRLLLGYRPQHRSDKPNAELQ